MTCWREMGGREGEGRGEERRMGMRERRRGVREERAKERKGSKEEREGEEGGEEEAWSPNVPLGTIKPGKGEPQGPCWNGHFAEPQHT